MRDIEIKVKDDSESWDLILELIKNAHLSNIDKIGLIMKTAFITSDELINRVKSGKTFIAITPEKKIIGTASFFIQFGMKWYDKGKKIAFLVYDAVHPDVQGKGVGKAIHGFRNDYIRERTDVEILKIGTAEKNMTVRSILEKQGFIPIELISNRMSNYYSAIYIKFLREQPLPTPIYRMSYYLSYIYFKCRYKKGKIERTRLIPFTLRVINKIKRLILSMCCRNNIAK